MKRSEKEITDARGVEKKTFAERVSEFRQTVITFVLEEAGVDGKGEDKLERVARKVAKWLDRELKFAEWFPFPIGALVEAIDGPLLTKIATLFVQWAFNELREKGRV